MRSPLTVILRLHWRESKTHTSIGTLIALADFCSCLVGIEINTDGTPRLGMVQMVSGNTLRVA